MGRPHPGQGPRARQGRRRGHVPHLRHRQAGAALRRTARHLPRDHPAYQPLRPRRCGPRPGAPRVTGQEGAPRRPLDGGARRGVGRRHLRDVAAAQHAHARRQDPSRPGGRGRVRVRTGRRVAATRPLLCTFGGILSDGHRHRRRRATGPLRRRLPAGVRQDGRRPRHRRRALDAPVRRIGDRRWPLPRWSPTTGRGRAPA